MRNSLRQILKGLSWIPVMVLLVACNEQVAAPTQVSATGGEGEAIVAWDDVEGATSYNVYWNATGKATGADASASSATSTHVVTGLRNESTYYFRVAAVSGAGESATSQQVTARATAAKLQSINITPAALHMALGTQQYLSATGVYSDGSTQNLSKLATWSSSDKAALTIIEAGKGAGRVTSAKTVGSAEVTARYKGVAAKTNVTVQSDTLDTLTDLVITPNNPYLRPAPLDRNARVAFKVFGTFASGLVQDLTATVVWSVEQPLIVSISNALGSEGVAKGLVAGTSGIDATAVFSDTTLTTRTTLTVTNLDMVALAIVAPRNTLPVGDTLDVTAAATFSDGTVKDIGSSVIWSSSHPGVLQALQNYGRITGVAIGVANLTATLPDSTLAFTKSFSVVPAIPSALNITPSGLVLIPGATQQITALVTYTDGRTVTDGLSWTSSNTAAARVSSSGLVTAVAPGMTEVQVRYTAPAGQTLMAAVVVAVTLPTGGAPDHTLLTNSCVSCHNGSVSTGKPTMHPTTTNLCVACHTTTSWRPVITVDHQQVLGRCAQCHDSVIAKGKGPTHLATSNLCEACHATTSWLPTATVDHTQALGTCVSCHASVAKLGHAVLPLQSCGDCHSTSRW